MAQAAQAGNQKIGFTPTPAAWSESDGLRSEYPQRPEAPVGAQLGDRQHLAAAVDDRDPGPGRLPVEVAWGEVRHAASVAEEGDGERIATCPKHPSRHALGMRLHQGRTFGGGLLH